jgi:hypothetical protein
MEVDVSYGWMTVALTEEGETLDILRLFEKTKKNFTLTVNEKDGTARDITGSAFRLDIYTRRIDGSSVVSWDSDTGTGLTLSDPTNGELTLAVLASNISLTTDNMYAWCELKEYTGGAISGDITDVAGFPAELLALTEPS